MKINIVCKNYIKDFLKIFTILLLSLSFLLAIVGLIEKIDDFMPYKPSLDFFIKYTIYSIPRYIFYLIPFMALISALFVFSLGVRSREFLIISVAGGRLRSVLKPFLVVGLIISISGFIFGEFVQPKFIKKINSMVSELSEKSKQQIQKELFIRTKDGTIYKIGTFFQENKVGNDVEIFIVKDNQLIKRIDSEKAYIKDKEWILSNVTVYDFVSGKIEKIPQLNYPANVKISISAFKDIKKIEEFGIIELINKRRELKKVGLSNAKIDTDISGKLSYNFVTFFMIVLGISLPLGAYEKFNFILSRSKKPAQSGGIITVGIGLIITIIYWLVYSLFMFMGYSKILPPFLAPWITPAVFGFISMKLYYAIKE